MSILNTITSWMKQVDVSGHYTPMPDIPDHNLQLIRFLINSKFQRDYSLEETQKLLYLEGLAPDKEYVPQWYLDKYYPSKKSLTENLPCQKPSKIKEHSRTNSSPS